MIRRRFSAFVLTIIPDSEAKQSYALEMLHVTLSQELRLLVISLLDNDLEYHQGLDALVAIFELDK